MTDKNHEQYLEQIEIAVMETTKELMSKHNGDLRAMAKVCAEKQVEINRLREYQNNDRKTIRNLRAQLAEATEEIEDINNRWVEDKEADRIEIEGLKDEIECRNSTWETKEKEYEGEIVELKEEIDLYKEELDIAHHEYDKIKAEIQRSTISEARSARDKALADNSTLKEDIKNLLQKIEGLKGEIEKWKYWASEVIHWSHSASKDNLQEKNLITSTDQPTIGDVRDFGKELSELKEEIKGLKEEIEFLKHQLDVGGMMNFSKYNDNDPN